MSYGKIRLISFLPGYLIKRYGLYVLVIKDLPGSEDMQMGKERSPISFIRKLINQIRNIGFS